MSNNNQGHGTSLILALCMIVLMLGWFIYLDETQADSKVRAPAYYTITGVVQEEVECQESGWDVYCEPLRLVVTESNTELAEHEDNQYGQFKSLGDPAPEGELVLLSIIDERRTGLREGDKVTLRCSLDTRLWKINYCQIGRLE